MSKRKPKFSIEEHVLGPNGIQKVYETFADTFDRERKGKGNETHDMSLILGMYRNWAHEMYPYEDPDVVLERVRKLKNNAQVRRAMHSFMEMGEARDDEGDKKKTRRTRRRVRTERGRRHRTMMILLVTMWNFQMTLMEKRGRGLQRR